MARWTQTRAKLGNIYWQAEARGEKPDPAAVAELRQRLRAEKARDYLEHLVRGEPALSSDQLADLGGFLLRRALGAGDDGA